MRKKTSLHPLNLMCDVSSVCRYCVFPPFFFEKNLSKRRLKDVVHKHRAIFHVLPQKLMPFVLEHKSASHSIINWRCRTTSNCVCTDPFAINHIWKNRTIQLSLRTWNASFQTHTLIFILSLQNTGNIALL